MKYAVFTVSTPDYMPEEAVRRIKDAGYDGIEWRVQDDPPSQDNPTFWSGNRATLPLNGLERDAAKWRALTVDAGLETPGIATYVKCNEPDRAELAMKGASALGAPALRIQVPYYDGTESFSKLWDASVQEYRVIAELSAQHGVKALVELHHRTIVPSAKWRAPIPRRSRSRPCRRNPRRWQHDPRRVGTSPARLRDPRPVSRPCPHEEHPLGAW